MKTLVLFAVAASISLASCGQNIPASKIPSVVLNTLQAKFTNATNTEWEKNKELYEAEFDIDSVEYKAHFDNSGKLIRHYSSIPETALPSSIQDMIKRDHSEYQVDDAEKLEIEGTVYYQVELEARGKKDKKLVFSTNGSISNIAYMD